MLIERRFFFLSRVLHVIFTKPKRELFCYIRDRFALFAERNRSPGAARIIGNSPEKTIVQRGA